MIHNQEKNKSTETDPELKQMLELADKGIKTYDYCVLYVQRAKGKIKHVKIRARKDFFKRLKLNFWR